MIEIRKTDETLYSLYRSRGFLIENRLYFIGVYSYAFLYFHDKSEIFRWLNLELALIDVDLESGLPKTLENLSYVVSMLSEGAVRINQDIVDVGRVEDVEVVTKGLVNILLEGTRRIR